MDLPVVRGPIVSAHPFYGHRRIRAVLPANVKYRKVVHIYSVDPLAPAFYGMLRIG